MAVEFFPSSLSEGVSQLPIFLADLQLNDMVWEGDWFRVILTGLHSQQGDMQLMNELQTSSPIAKITISMIKDLHQDQDGFLQKTTLSIP